MLGKGGGLHQVLGRTRALFLVALSGGSKRDATEGNGLSVCSPFVRKPIFPSLRYHSPERLERVHTASDEGDGVAFLSKETAGDGEIS